jgi:acetyl esterase/lipase
MVEGYTVGTVDEFENGIRIVAEEAGFQVYGVEYRLAPGWRFPNQLDGHGHCD